MNPHAVQVMMQDGEKSGLIPISRCADSSQRGQLTSISRSQMHMMSHSRAISGEGLPVFLQPNPYRSPRADRGKLRLSPARDAG